MAAARASASARGRLLRAVGRERRHQAARPGAVDVAPAQVQVEVGRDSLLCQDAVEIGLRPRRQVGQCLGHQRFLGSEVVVERPVRETGRLHDLADADAREAALAEQPGRFLEDAAVLGGGFFRWIAHLYRLHINCGVDFKHYIHHASSIQT